MGRPKSESNDVKRHQCNFRINDETKVKLEQVAYRTGQSKAEVFEKALNLYEISTKKLSGH